MEYFEAEDDTGTYELLIPFVAVESNGGPFEDEAFVAGFQLGRLWECLRDRDAQEWWFDPVLDQQILLIAGHFRMLVTCTKADNSEAEDHGMMCYTFNPAPDLDDDLANLDMTL